MPLHVVAAEYIAREHALLAAMAERRLDGMLLFAQESLYWLTGYDTFGFCFFQGLVLRADGRRALLTRSADLRQAALTSNLTDVRVWRDGAGAEPVRELAAIAAELGLADKRLGVEYDTHGLTHANGRAVEAAFAGAAGLVDASDLVPRLRAVKSPAELAFVRRAAALCDEADAAGIAATRAGAGEGEVLAAMHGAVLRGGGELPANEFICGAGPDALLCRSRAGRRTIAPRDQLTLEFAAAWNRYAAAIMRTLVVGEPRPEHLTHHAAAREALLACEAALVPGNTMGDVFAAHARVLDAHGLGAHRLNACGYSLGARFAPSWMDPPMAYEGNPWPLVPSMVVFLHMILMDSASGTAMTLGRTSLVTAGAAEPLNAPSLDLVVIGA